MTEIDQLLIHAEKMASLVQESKQLSRDISSLESYLISSGSTETMDDVKAKLEKVDASL